MKKLVFFLLAISGIICSATQAQSIKDTISLPGVEISDSLSKAFPFRVNTLNKLTIRNAEVRDMGDFLRTIPNVAGVRKGGASIDPVVRGFKYSQLSVNVGGGLKVENGCPNRMDPVTSHVEAEDIEDVEVFKGPFALKYGPSFGGIINLKTENPRPFEKFEVHANGVYGFETNWNGQKQHVSVLGGNKKIYFLLSGGSRNYGSYQSKAAEGRDTTFKSSFRKYNYTAKLGFSPTKNQQIILSYDEIHGRNVLFPALPMDEKSDDTRMLAADYKLTNGKGLLKTLDINLYHSDVDHTMDNSLRANWASKQMVSVVDALNTGGRAEAGIQLKKIRIATGIDFENIYKDGTRTMTMQMMGTTSTKKSNLWKEAKIVNAGIFGEFHYPLGASDLMAALRFDLNSAGSEDTLLIKNNDAVVFENANSQYTNVSASLGLTRHINRNLNVSLAIGRGVRSPNMLERFIKLMTVGYDNYDYLGNPELKPETNYEADLTVSYSLQKVGSIYINGFYSHVKDYIFASLLPSSVVKPQSAGVLGVKQFVNVDNVSLKGFEFGYTSPRTYKFGGSIIGAFTYGIIPEVTQYIVSGGAVTDQTVLKNDALSEIPPFESTLILHYNLFKDKLIPQISFRVVADQNHVSEAFYEKETPGFALVNFSLKYTLNKYARMTAGVNNLLDRAYYEHLNRKIIGSTLNLYEPGRSFFVNLFFNI